MTIPLRRVILVLTALVAAYVGAWAGFAPTSWYRSFPGLGLRWLPVLGPYNEHLARDVGFLYLAIAALALGAALRPANDGLVRTTGLAVLVFSVPHLVFHVLHLARYGPLDRVLNIATLGAFVLVGLVLLLPLAPSRPVAPRVARADRAG